MLSQEIDWQHSEIAVYERGSHSQNPFTQLLGHTLDDTKYRVAFTHPLACEHPGDNAPLGLKRTRSMAPGIRRNNYSVTSLA